MSRQVVLTGIRANNDLTLGNYFGAITPIIDMAKNKSREYDVNLFVPDLHSFTTPIDHSLLQEQIMHNLRLFIASGLPLNHENVRIYRQSYIPAHSELTWILNCFTGIGEMARMTQFKDKSAKISEDRVSLGLYTYPVLMASDILLYGAAYVPVGDDQAQHLEFTRDIAQRVNNKFNQELFIIPKSVKEQHKFFGMDQGLRIKDLQSPANKMSKSDDSGKGVVFLGDNPEVAAKKIMSATTDSVGKINLDWEKQPGISNLLQLLALFDGRNIDEIASEWQGNTSYGELKNTVASRVRDFLLDLQSKLSLVNDNDINNKLNSSEIYMNKSANETLFKVQKALGLR